MQKENTYLNLTQLIVGLVAFSQGVQHLADLSIQYLYKDQFQLSPSMMGLFVGITAIPWIIKPVWGIMADSFAIFGSKRKAYIVIFGCVSGSGWILMSYYGQENIYLTVGLLTMISTAVCVCNVVGEALMVEQSTNQHASKNVSIFFGFKAVGGIFSAYFSGLLLMHLNKSQIFIINSIFPFTMAILSLFLKESDDIQSRLGIRDVLKIFWRFFQDPRIYQASFIDSRIYDGSLKQLNYVLLLY